jgi:hypothetical protein
VFVIDRCSQPDEKNPEDSLGRAEPAGWLDTTHKPVAAVHTV